MLIVVVTAASLSDQAGARKIFKQMRGTCKKLRKVWVDGTYRGAEWTAWVKAQYNIVLESVARAEGQKGGSLVFSGVQNYCIINYLCQQIDVSIS